MTENQTVQIDATELARLQEAAAPEAAAAPARETMELSTRERSPIKPQDHKPAAEHSVTVEFAGEKYEFDVRAATDTRTMFALRKEDMETVIIRVLGEDALERVITSIEDEDGFADFKKLADFVQAVYEKAGSKNS